MKKIVCIFVVMSLILLSTACNADANNQQDVLFFYRIQKTAYDSPIGLIDSEPRIFYKNVTAQGILNTYFSGPIHNEFISPFPENTALVDIQFEDTNLDIVLNDSFAEQTGAHLTLACVCIYKTVSSIYRIKTVRISAENVKLNGQDVITLTSESVFYYDDAEPAS